MLVADRDGSDDVIGTNMGKEKTREEKEREKGEEEEKRTGEGWPTSLRASTGKEGAPPWSPYFEKNWGSERSPFLFSENSDKVGNSLKIKRGPARGPCFFRNKGSEAEPLPHPWRLEAGGPVGRPPRAGLHGPAEAEVSIGSPFSLSLFSSPPSLFFFSSLPLSLPALLLLPLSPPFSTGQRRPPLALLLSPSLSPPSLSLFFSL